MAEIVSFVRQNQEEEEEVVGETEGGESRDEILAEFANGTHYQIKIILTPEEEHRCAIDPEYLKEVIAKAEHELEIQQCYEVAEAEKDELSSVNTGLQTSSAKWSDDKIRLLLSLVKELGPHVMTKKRNRRSGWDAVAELFNQNGYNESAGTLSKKWFNLKDRYKIVKLKKESLQSEHTTWPYFETMDEILKHRDEEITPTDTLLSSLSLNIQSGADVSSPSADKSDSASNYESYCETQQRKRRRKQMTGRSKKRRLRGQASDQTVHKAPGWFMAYLKGTKEERKWKEEISYIMKDGSNAVKLLAASVVALVRK